MILLLCAPFAAVCARWNGEVPGGNAGSLKLPAAADSCKIFVVGAGGKFPGREKIGISQQSTRPVGRNFLGPDFRETPGFIRQKENSYLKARWEIPMNDGGQLQKAPFPGLKILFPSPIQTKKTTQSCDPTRRLSKTVKVVSITRLLVVEKKISRTCC